MKTISFDEKLNIDDGQEEEIKIEIKYKKPKFHEKQIDDINSDYKFLRNKMRFLMASGEVILNKSLISLSNDPSPRAIEASSIILRNVVKISSEILTLHEKTKNLVKEETTELETDDGTVKSSLVDIINEIQKNKD